MSPYKGRRLTLDLDTGQRLVISVCGVTGCSVVEISANPAENSGREPVVNSLELFDGTGTRIAGGRVRSWADALVRRGGAS